MKIVRKYISIIFGLSLLLLEGCIKNDIPYPVVELQITSIDIEGALSAPVIDEVTRTVTVELEEQTDIRNVKINAVTYTEGATVSQDIVGVHDMRNSIYVTLSLYQHYPWRICATQNITRELPHDPAILSLSIYPREMKTCVHTENLRHTFVAALFVNAK